MRSMTGYGKGVACGYSRKVNIELRAVNHRYLDLLFKLPRGFAFCEDVIRKIIDGSINRGHIDIYCTYEDNREGKSKVSYDKVVAKQYKDIALELESQGFVNDMTAGQVLRMPEVLNTQAEDDDEEIIVSLIKDATQEAVQNLLSMSNKEGAILNKDLLSKLDNLQALTDEIAQRAPQVALGYAEKLRARIEESLNNVEIDEGRLLNEVAFFVDKANIDEELTRLNGHIQHARAIFVEEGAIGKKLDFLVQEMNREINTTGSKCNDLYLTQRVLKAKNEIEMIREQIQNIE